MVAFVGEGMSGDVPVCLERAVFVGGSVEWGRRCYFVGLVSKQFFSCAPSTKVQAPI